MKSQFRLVVAFGVAVSFGCSPKSEPVPSGTSSGGRAGMSNQGGSTGTGGSTTVGTGGSGGTNPSASGGSGTAGAGGTGGVSGTAGASGGSGGTSNGSTDAAPKDAVGEEIPPAAGTASCAGKDYVLCLDFESGLDTATWTGGSANAVVTTHPAHGTHSYRLYPMGGSVLKTTKLGTMKDQIWGRFYVHFNPGAPGGHGNLVGAFDQANNWYEMGWQFDAMMGVYHLANGSERALRSMPLIVDQWYCVELFFDGTKTNMPQWWIDGKEGMYYMPLNTQLIPRVVNQFARLEVGFTPYAGLGLQMPDGKGPIDTRVLKETWIDDVAFDTKRIGCIDGPVGMK